MRAPTAETDIETDRGDPVEPPGIGAAALALTLLLAGACVAAGDEGSPSAGESRVDVRTVSGRISALAWSAHKLTIDVDGRPVLVEVDRNTAVFLDGRLGTLSDLAVGAPVRASLGGGERAVWIELRPRPAPAAGAPDGGAEITGGLADGGTEAGPPVLAMPESDGGTVGGRAADGGTAPSPAPDAGVVPPPPRSAPSGPPPPEPQPVKPPPAREPRPAGPSRVPGGPAQG